MTIEELKYKMISKQHEVEYALKKAKNQQIVVERRIEDQMASLKLYAFLLIAVTSPFAFIANLIFFSNFSPLFKAPLVILMWGISLIVLFVVPASIYGLLKYCTIYKLNKKSKKNIFVPPAERVAYEHLNKPSKRTTYDSARCLEYVTARYLGYLDKLEKLAPTLKDESNESALIEAAEKIEAMKLYVDIEPCDSISKKELALFKAIGILSFVMIVTLLFYILGSNVLKLKGMF